jgi:hypothetical protein
MTGVAAGMGGFEAMGVTACFALRFLLFISLMQALHRVSKRSPFE